MATERRTVSNPRRSRAFADSPGPVRSGDPERDWYWESRAAPGRGAAGAQLDSDEAARQRYRRMSWRAAGAQDYPGGAYDVLLARSYRGRGPKGYTRSDERLRELICEQLTDDPFIDASEITVDVRNQEVTLQGTVPLRRMKHAIEDIAADVCGVKEIHNRLQVRDEAIEARMSGL